MIESQKPQITTSSNKQYSPGNGKHAVGFACQQLGLGANKIATIIAGYKGKIEHFSQPAETLRALGYDVLLYEYSSEVFDRGDPQALATLIHDIGIDFTRRAAGYAHVRHTGPSLGGGIAWNLQKLDTDRALPGVFVAAGTDAAKLIFRNPLFWTARSAFVRGGVTRAALSAAYSQVLEPPHSPFLLPLGGLDLIIPLREITAKIEAFQDRTHTPVKIILRRGAGHTAMIKWYCSHIGELVAQADAISHDSL